jgi:hypothetical protein
MFLAAPQRPKSLHDYHAIHHNFTTKTPHETIAFPATPFQKAHKDNKNHPFLPPKKKSEKTGLGYLNGLEEQTGRRHS